MVWCDVLIVFVFLFIRVNTVVIDHFRQHQGLLCMYNNTSFVKEVGGLLNYQ